MVKKPTAEQVKNVLGAGYFENTRTIEDKDPIEPISMKLSIDQVKKYDRNPRQARNPSYNDILESLRANGQEEALTITRRPGDEQYMIKRGGNTRLEIMNMLYHEAGDERFEIIECLFMPWTNESDCVVGHLNENTTQGKMTLIDKARGYRNFKILYEEENEVELGQRKLAELLKAKGAPVGKTILSTMNYALDVLEPAIPETLARGLGKPQIEKLKRLDQTFQRLAEAHNLYDPVNRADQVQAELHQLLSDHDGDEWDMELVMHEFSQRLGELLDQVPYNRLKFDIDECAKRDPWKVELMSTLEDEPPPPLDQTSPESVNAATTSTQRDLTSTVAPSHPGTSSSPEPAPQITATEETSTKPVNTETATTPSPQTTDITATESTTTEQRLTIPTTAMLAGEIDLKSMRARIYTLALKFANATKVHHCLVNWNYGYGYFMDLPKSRLNTIMTTEQNDLQHFEYKLVTNRFSKERDDAERTFAWWLLWQTQGILDFNDNPVPGYQVLPESMMKTLINQIYNPEDNRMFVMMLSALHKVRLEVGGPTNMMDMAMAYSYVRPANMMKYVELLEARTQLMAYVEENNINIWGN